MKSLVSLKVFICLLLTGIIPMVVRAQLFAGYEIQAYSSAAAALPTSASPLLINPAQLLGNSMFVSAMRPFGVRELDEFQFAISHSLSENRKSLESAGFQISSLGTSLYRETQIVAGISGNAGRARLGGAIGYRDTRVTGYGYAGQFQLHAGLSIPFVENLSWVAVIHAADVFTFGNFLPANYITLLTGFAFQPDERIELMSVLVQMLNQKPQTDTGIRFNAWQIGANTALHIGGGYSSGTNAWSGGLEISANTVRFGYAVRTHPFLSLTHTVGIGKQW